MVTRAVVDPAGAAAWLAGQRRAAARKDGPFGIGGRDAFNSPATVPAHHLYVCQADSRELARHLAFRDCLRGCPGQARAYAELKRSLAVQFGSDRDAYARGKTAFVEQALTAAARPRLSLPPM